jgi:NodT family efflux transporter outer membrane factor (OMF) lipoprotein
MRPALPLLLATALAGCTVGPDYHAPAIALAPRFAAGPITPPAVGAPWWAAFNDPLLNTVVERALAQNMDIAAASARVDQARAAARGAGAALLPVLSAQGAAEQDHISRQTPFGAASGELGFPRDYGLYQAGVQASWEVDLFGGLRRGREAARAEAASAQARTDAVRLSIAAETVDAYLQLRGLQARLAVAQGQLADEHDLVALIRQRVGEGLSADRDLNRVTGEEQGIEASLAPLRAGIAAQINRLDVLMGAPAGTWDAQLAPPAAIPQAPDPSGSAIPAELMRRRPDVVAAERQVASANARIGAAMADYYPHLSLGGLLGAASLGTANILSSNAFQASGTAGLSWRLFDFGRIDAQVAQARGREAEALALYRGTVLRATQDVETALASLTQQRLAMAAYDRQVAALTAARDQARQAYDQGAVALIDVLDADRALLQAADRRDEARAGAARASVAVTRALGGGWENRA